MAVYTSIDAQDLDRFLARYGLPPADRFEGIAAGIENTNYRIWTDGQRLILTLYEGRTDAGDLPYFLDLMSHAAGGGAATAAALKDERGEMLGTLSGRPAALVEHLPGADVERPGPRHASAAGAALARFHLAVAGFAPKRPNALGPAAWYEAATLLDLDRVIPSIAAAAQSRIETLRSDWPQTLPTGTIHADLFPDNVLFHARTDTVSGIIDLYFACTDALAYDLAIAMAAWTPERVGGTPDPRNARALRRGYESVRGLSDTEVGSLPRLVEGAAWRFFLTRAEDRLQPRASQAGRIKDPLPFWHLAQHVASNPTHLTETR